MRELSQALGILFFKTTTFLLPSQFDVPHMQTDTGCRGRVTSDRWSYLEKVRDVRMDLVDDSNAVAEDS